jgi:DNA-binding transcriptional MerR regulator
MGTTYRIADVAERSGFTPAALRYYEEIGLMAPVGRTDAGYRLYDDASLERLRFIARAKQLGCTLDEIAELATAWDGGECGPVQDRLRATVEAKVGEASTRIAELTSLTAELRRAADALSGHRPDGRCDDGCGCVADSPAATPAATTPAAARPAATSEATTETPAIACTLDAGAMPSRLEDWNAVLQSVVARHPLDDGVRLELAPGTDLAEVARLAAAEHGCCRFFGFALVIDTRGLALEVHAPPDATDLVTALFGATR